jgi:hypothetical protein
LKIDLGVNFHASHHINHRGEIFFRVIKSDSIFLRISIIENSITNFIGMLIRGA